MNIRELNEAIESLLEGEVIDFNSFKKSKEEPQSISIEELSADTLPNNVEELKALMREQWNTLIKGYNGIKNVPTSERKKYVKNSELVKEKIAKLGSVQAEETPKEEPKADLQGTNKSNADEVAEGDILVGNFGYSMILPHFYKVIARTKSSIKLARLEDKVINADRYGQEGQKMPVDNVVADREVDGKIFRIVKNYPYSEPPICKVGRTSLHYWDGQPKTWDTYD